MDSQSLNAHQAHRPESRLLMEQASNKLHQHQLFKPHRARYQAQLDMEFQALVELQV